MLNSSSRKSRPNSAPSSCGWADGNIEPYEFTDVDRTVAGGLSLAGKQWGRPDDTVGLAGVVDGITGVHIRPISMPAVSGILIGDGQLPNYGPRADHRGVLQLRDHRHRRRLPFDYQFIANPAYNTQRGPVNVFAGRLHTQF